MSTSNTPKFNPDFSHRLSALSQYHKGFTANDLTDSIMLMCDRASAIVDVVALQFSEDAGRMSDAINYAALSAAVHEIGDIQAVIRAYYAQQQAQKKPEL